MKTLKNFKELEGKTIKKVFKEWFSSNKLVLIFSDNTLAVIGIERGYDSTDDEVGLQEFFYEDYNPVDIIDAGLETREGLDERNRQKFLRQQADQRAYEHKEYLRLKAKFDTDS